MSRKSRLSDRHVSKTTDIKDRNHNKEIEKQQLEGNRSGKILKKTHHKLTCTTINMFRDIGKISKKQKQGII